LAASKFKKVQKIQSIADKAAAVRELGTAVAQGDTKALLEMGSGAALGMVVKKGASKVQNTTASVSKPNGEASTATKKTGWGEQAGSPHVANVTVRGPDGKIVHQGRTTSGSMTPTEKEFGFPQGQNSSHTEAKTVMDPSSPSGPGNTMTITGGKPPCNSCKGYMNTHAEATGTKVRYQWRQNGKTNRWETGE
jgi:hypothetical protein